MKHPGKNLHAEDYIVRPVSLVTCRELVHRYHRQGGGSILAVFRHGLFQKKNAIFDDSCLGITWWLPPTKVAAIATYNGDWRRVLGLSRLVCVPDAPRNSASFLLAKSIDLIRQSGKWDCLVTYASSRFGHNGAIYKATNWECLGETSSAPIWIDPSTGYEVAKKATRTRTVAEMKELGYRMIGKFPKIKYRMVLN